MGEVKSKKLTLHQEVAYAAPAGITNFLFVPTTMLISGIYAKYFGLELTVIAAVMLFARLFDGITDPIIGYLSDRHRLRGGTRKPFLVVGCITLLICSYFLYVPPDDVSVVYFAFWFFAFYLAYTLVEIPHYAWGSEIVSTQKEKSRLFSLRVAFYYGGGILFYILPMLPVFEVKEFTPEILKWTVLIVGVLMAPVIYWCVASVPVGRRSETQTVDSFLGALATIFLNWPLLLLLGAICFSVTGSYMFLGVKFIYMDAYLQMGELISITFILSIIVGISSIGLLYRLSNKYGKVKVWVSAITIAALSLALVGLISPGQYAPVYFIALSCIVGIGVTAINVLGPVFLSDVIDYARWKFGADRAGVYFASYMLVMKFSSGFGAALGLGIAGWYGFDPTSVVHSSGHIFGLRLAVAYTPMAFLLVSVIFILRMPISESRQIAIRRRLDVRAKNAEQYSYAGAVDK